jgi:ArsR family transcriptional regulator
MQRSATKLESLEEMLWLLGNSTRFRIIRRLSVSPTYFLDLVRLLDSGPQAVVRHLKLMEEAGIVRSWEEERTNRKYFGLARKIRLTVDVNSGELTCQTERIPKSQGRQALASSASAGAMEEMRRIEEESVLLERRLNMLRKRREVLLKRYCGRS